MEKNLIFKNEVMYIEGNVISCKQYFIQISNITQAWIGPMPKRGFPTGAVVGLVIAAILLSFISQWFIIALIMALGAVALMIYVIYSYSNEPIVHGFHIELTSSRVYSFTSTNGTSLKTAYDTVIEILKNKNMLKSEAIDFGTHYHYTDNSTNTVHNGDIIDNSVDVSATVSDVSGNVNIGANNSIVVNDKELIAELVKILAEYEKQFPDDDSGAQIIVEAKEAAEKSDDSALKKALAKFTPHMADIAKQITAGIVCGLIFK